MLYLRGVGDVVVQRIRDRMVRDGKVARGTLYDSMGYELLERGGRYNLSLRYVDHGRYVLSGRRVGARMPPVSVIEDWVRVRGIVVGGGDRGIRSLSWAISKSIVKKGIRPYNFLEVLDSFVGSREYLGGLKDALGRDIRGSIEGDVIKKIKRG